jgi:hypothetical protein
MKPSYPRWVPPQLDSEENVIVEPQVDSVGETKIKAKQSFLFVHACYIAHHHLIIIIVAATEGQAKKLVLPALLILVFVVGRRWHIEFCGWCFARGCGCLPALVVFLFLPKPAKH